MAGTKQPLAALLGYMTCDDPVVKQKYENILASFYHKDEGILITSVDADGNGGTNITFSDGGTLNLPALPTSKPISFITGLLDALNTKVDAVVGKGLSEEDFTTAFKNKLAGLNNYVHPEKHLISEIDQLPEVLDTKVDKVEGKGLSTNDLTNELLATLATTSYVDNAVASIPTFPAPYLEELVPDSHLPSTTGNFILYGSYFTEGMCDGTIANAIIVEGQTINYCTFISDNEIHVNITTGSAEGEFDVTLNNGSQTVVFPNTLLIVLGEVFKPVIGEWEAPTGSLNVADEGEAKIAIFNTLGSNRWSKQLDFTKNIVLRFKLKASPLGLIVQEYQQHHLSLVRNSDNVVIYTANFKAESTVMLNYVWDIVSGGWNPVFTTSGGTIESRFNAMALSTFEFKILGGVMYYYVDGVLKKTFTGTVTENLKLKVNLKSFDIVDIKYIELAT